MLAAEYLALNDALAVKGAVFSFKGYLSENILFSLGEALRHKMTQEESDANKIRRLFSVFVEQAQNIIRYSAERFEDGEIALSSGIITVGREEGGFFVVCANMIDRRYTPELKERLEEISKMDAQELKAFYRQKLREPVEEDAKGAGIGLIEIARRASAPIAFDFVDVDETHSFFCIKASI